MSLNKKKNDKQKRNHQTHLISLQRGKGMYAGKRIMLGLISPARQGYLQLFLLKSVVILPLETLEYLYGKYRNKVFRSAAGQSVYCEQ
jgi:hypothetical protein